MARPDELIGIGEFARRVRLSVKQLRSYDKLGLLAPAYVDPDSGYRCYDRGQARTAITIALLRSLDVPLADVHELLVADETRATVLLERQQERIAQELERGRRTLRSLERLLGAQELLPYEVVERDEPARELIGLRGACEAEALERAAPALVANLLESVPAAGERGGPPVVGFYPLELEGEIEFFVGVEKARAQDAHGGVEKARARHARGGEEHVRLGATRVAVTTHVGRYEEIALAYFPLLAHAHERGLTLGDVARETYIDDPATVASDRVRTEVALPIGGQGTKANESQQPS